MIIPALLLILSCSSGISGGEEPGIGRRDYSAGVSVHDPSIIKAEGRYYLFGSHMEAARSDDLLHWTGFASGVSRLNPLFSDLFTEMRAFDFVGKNDRGTYSVWAPDVIYNPSMGKYMMYFCTTSSYIRSTICFALADRAEGPYAFGDTVVYSGFTGRDMGRTNVEEFAGPSGPERYFAPGSYNNMLWPNAIDPNLFYDGEGRLWMSYGSWSGGIFLLEIDRSTGYPIHPGEDEAAGVDPYFGKHLAGGYHNSVEGPYVIYDGETGYYYLFVSYGSLVSSGGYQIRLFRSPNPEGPYRDRKGESLDRGKTLHAPYGVKLMGNYDLPSLLTAYMAPGHNSALIEDSGEIYLVHHVRFDDGSEYHEPRVRRLFRTADGWLAAAPFAFGGGEKRALGLRGREIGGTYYLVNHGTDIGPKIHSGVEYRFGALGRITGPEGKRSGSWSYDGKGAGMVLTLSGEEFTGVLIEQEDESGNPVLAFTGLSGENESLWAVRYR